MNNTPSQSQLLEIAKQCGMSFDERAIHQKAGADVYFKGNIITTLEMFARLTSKSQPSIPKTPEIDTGIVALIDELIKNSKAEEAYEWQEEEISTRENAANYAKQLSATRTKLIERIAEITNSPKN